MHGKLITMKHSQYPDTGIFTNTYTIRGKQKHKSKFMTMQLKTTQNIQPLIVQNALKKKDTKKPGGKY